MRNKVAYATAQHAHQAAAGLIAKYGPLRVYEKDGLFFLTSHKLGESTKRANARKAKAAAYMQRWMPAKA